MTGGHPGHPCASKNNSWPRDSQACYNKGLSGLDMWLEVMSNGRFRDVRETGEQDDVCFSSLPSQDMCGEPGERV